MPYYQYERPAPNPYAGTIAEILGRQGQTRAQQQLTLGEIAARQAQQTGNAWGQAWQGIGQTIAAIPQQIQQARDFGLRREADALDLTVKRDTLNRQRRIQMTHDAINAAMADRSILNEDGTYNVEGIAKLAQQMPEGAVGPTEPLDLETLYKTVNPINDSIRAAQASRQKAAADRLAVVGRISKEVLRRGGQTGNYLDYLPLAAAPLLKSGLATQDEVNQVVLPLIERPDQATAILSEYAKYAPAEPGIKLGEGEKYVGQQTGQVIAEGAPKRITNEVELTQAAVAGVPGAQEALDKLNAPKPLTEYQKQDLALQRQRLALQERGLNLRGGSGFSEEDVAYWVRQVQNDPTVMTQLRPELKLVVQKALPAAGVDINKLTAASKAMQETAREILPHITTIQTEAQNLQARGLMGPLGSRWRDFITGKVGADALVGGGENARLAAKFKTDVGLLMTAVARAHGGARGGGSPTMLEHMRDLINAHSSSLDMFLGNLDATRDWMQGYATMGQSHQTDEGPITTVGGFKVRVKP